MNLILNKGNDNHFFLSDSVTSKGLKVECLHFKMYLECLLEHTSSSQLSYKIISKYGQLHYLKVKRKGVNSFNNSNFLHSCGLCVSPISSKNTFLCADDDCKVKMLYLQVLYKNFDNIFNSKYNYSDGELSIIDDQ